MIIPSPQVCGATLSAHVNQPVRIVGEVAQNDVNNSGNIILNSCDGQSVTVQAGTLAGGNFSRFVEITGNVNADATVRGLTSVNLGDDFDLALYNEVLQKTMAYPDLFKPNLSELQ
eukprot:Nk52_evm69s207 gene=Nk52_evmTU69s207